MWDYLYINLRVCQECIIAKYWMVHNVPALKSKEYIVATINVKIFAGNKFRGRGTYTYRWDILVKNFSRSAPYAKIFIPAYYIILPIYVESFSWQYTAALCGSYIVDIVSRARLLHWSVSVDHWQWQVKTRLRGNGEWRHDCTAVASEDTTVRQWRVKTRLAGSNGEGP